MKDIHTPCGDLLAKRVALYLEARWGIGNFHRDYCGTGLWWQDGIFYHAHFHDGDPSIDHPDDGSTHGWIARFENRSQFITWLAVQTDLSLSGCAVNATAEEVYKANQRLTRAVLEAAVR